MTNYLTIERILRNEDGYLPITTIQDRARKRGNDMQRTVISSILNRMERKDKVESKVEQVSRRQIKFWKLPND